MIHGEEPVVRWDRRFFESTRGRIVTLLRRDGRTVEDLAGALGLTDNGVRSHLAILERDGIVRQRGSVRRGGSKPAYVYELTPEAEALFSRAYKPVLRRLVDVLTEELGSDDSEALLRKAGRRMAEGRVVTAGSVRERLGAAVGTLNELGSLAELEERDGGFVVRAYSCPLAAVAADHPEVCRMMEALLGEAVGVEVRERCDRSEERPRCRFEAVPGESGGG
jgi:predicted ArsR family transcriptional regulator